MEFDKFDSVLLNLVQNNSGQTAERLAEQVPLSPSAIQRRLKRLREAGVIARDISVVALEKVGSPSFFIVGLQVERERPEHLAQLRRWLSSEERIEQAWYVTGEFDFIAVVTAATTEEYEALMRRLMTENQNVKRFTTNVSLGVVKRGLFVPISE